MTSGTAGRHILFIGKFSEAKKCKAFFQVLQRNTFLL